MQKIQNLQAWCRRQCDGYPGVNVVNMTSSFKDGLAFCAILHRFRPDLVDFSSLKPGDVFTNNQLAFSIAESQLDIPALLDASDMELYKVPDKLCVVTYVNQYHNKFKDCPKVGGPNVSAYDNTTTQTSSVLKRKSKDKMGDKCYDCGRKVYLLERHLLDNHQLLHRSCYSARLRSQTAASDSDSSSISSVDQSRAATPPPSSIDQSNHSVPIKSSAPTFEPSSTPPAQPQLQEQPIRRVKPPPGGAAVMPGAEFAGSHDLIVDTLKSVRQGLRKTAAPGSRHSSSAPSSADSTANRKNRSSAVDTTPSVKPQPLIGGYKPLLVTGGGGGGGGLNNKAQTPAPPKIENAFEAAKRRRRADPDKLEKKEQKEREEREEREKREEREEREGKQEKPLNAFQLAKLRKQQRKEVVKDPHSSSKQEVETVQRTAECKQEVDQLPPPAQKPLNAFQLAKLRKSQQLNSCDSTTQVNTANTTTTSSSSTSNAKSQANSANSSQINGSASSNHHRDSPAASSNPFEDISQDENPAEEEQHRQKEQEREEGEREGSSAEQKSSMNPFDDMSEDEEEEQDAKSRNSGAEDNSRSGGGGSGGGGGGGTNSQRVSRLQQNKATPKKSLANTSEKKVQSPSKTLPSHKKHRAPLPPTSSSPSPSSTSTTSSTTSSTLSTQESRVQMRRKQLVSPAEALNGNNETTKVVMKKVLPVDREFHFDSDDLDPDNATSATSDSPVAPARRHRRTIAAPSFTFEDEEDDNEDTPTSANEDTPTSAALATPPAIDKATPKRAAPQPPKDAQRYKDPRRKVNAEKQMSNWQLRSQKLDIEKQMRSIEARGRQLEIDMREDENLSTEDEKMWFSLINEQIELTRQEKYLNHRENQQKFEAKHEQIETDIRKLMEIPEHLKTASIREKEELLLMKLVEVVQERSKIVNLIEQDRLSYIMEDEVIANQMAHMPNINE